MDKIVRELEDLNNSQTSVLKKLAQIETENITLGIAILEQKLPDLHEQVDSSVTTVSEILLEFQEYREKFFVDNKLEALIDPTV